MDSTSSATHSATKSLGATSTKIERVAVVTVFLIMFILNSINGENDSIKIYAQPQNKQVIKSGDDNTAIIITSSWIPSHPSTYMVESVLNSTLEHLIGLSPTTPIFITIDHFRYSDFENLPPSLKEKIATLEEYAVNLLSKYIINPRVHIIPAVMHLHIGGSIMKALNLMELTYPNVRYVYSLQHDFIFTRNVDHTALVTVMDEHSDKINYILFPKRHFKNPACGAEQPIKYNQSASFPLDAPPQPSPLTLSPFGKYSDNNHIARFSWYKDVIASLITLTRAPEMPLQRRANDGCNSNKSMGLYLYYEQNLGHLDGRETLNVPLTL